MLQNKLNLCVDTVQIIQSKQFSPEFLAQDKCLGGVQIV